MATNVFHGDESKSWRRIYFMARNLFHGDESISWQRIYFVATVVATILRRISEVERAES